ncbi:MAG: HAMP domain-containing sensor histidine kinase [Gammaproteobacteria bacterium]|jgi:two-component system sensor histidine kinase PilS (NtrC family)
MPTADVSRAVTGEPIPGQETGGSVAPEFAWRVLRLVNVFRTLAAVFLMAMFLLTDEPRLIGNASPDLFFVTALAYFVCGALNDFAVTQRWPSVMGQSLGQATVDTAALTVLAHASGGIDSGIANLLIVSIGAISLIWSRSRAVMFGAMAAIAVVFEQYLSILQGTAILTDSTPAGVLGGILLFISVAAHPLARRIQESENLARQRGIDLANLGQLNDYIIRNLRESIVVVDSDDRVRLMNDAAAKYLGTDRDQRGVSLEAVSPRLLELASAWRRGSNNDTASPSLLAADGITVINPYFAPIGEGDSAALIIFLEDASALAERVQQSKLAALGRLSASIAHEIRNPVGAMSHAGQLLSESAALDEQDHKLTEIIETNARRVSAIIDNVLQLSRRDYTSPERVDLVPWAESFANEFTTTAQIPRDRLQVVATSESVEVQVDPSHLHQIVWNLCENALRYGMAMDNPDGTVDVVCGRRMANDRPFLEIRDRGPGIPEAIRDRIFEPFFRGAAAERSGSGLGLFISRELCECNRAALVYEPRTDGGSIFRIIFADPQRWEP